MKIFENITNGYRKIASGIAIVAFLTLMYFALIPGGTAALSGVYSMSGDGIGTAFVKLVDYPQYNATTISDGTYAMNNVPYGEYDISAQAPRYLRNASTVNVSSSSVTKNFSLYEGSLTGEIRHYSTVDNELTSSKVSTLSDVGKSFVIPSYGNGVSWNTKVYITDYSGLGSALTVQYYNEAGIPGVIENPTIPPNGTISWTPTDGTNSRPFIGKMVITSTNNVTGEFILNSTSSTDLISSRFYTSADMGTSFLIPSYGNGVNWHTFVAISDLSGSGAALTLKYYDVNGNLVRTETPNVPANGMYKFIPTDGTVPGRPLVGSLEISSTQTITGEFRVYSTTNAGILSNKLYTSTDKKNRFVIPSYGNGVSWHSWIAISDVSGLGANLTIKYYDSAGTFVTKETTYIIPKGMYRTVLTDGTNGRPLLGKLEISSDNNIAGEMRIYPASGRGITASSLYTEQDISNILIVPYYGNNNKFHTYLALSDFSGYSGSVRLEYHSLSGGAPVKTETQTILADGMYKWGVLEGTGGAPIEGNIFIYR